MGEVTAVKSWIKPGRLKPGDTVGIVAPSSNLKPDLLARGVRELESLGFRTRVRDDIVEKDRYTAGPASRRMAELRAALADDEVRAIFCARGGYGSGQLLGKPVDRLPDTAHPRTGPKCTAVYSGRPRGRCGWPTTVVWVFRRNQGAPF